VFAGDTVTAGGVLEKRYEADGERRTRCAVWLDRDGTRLVSGTADVAIAHP
jgi:hypothetical protein